MVDELSSFKKDHPRVCGENRCSTKACCCTIGSPPRVRGKPRTRRVKLSSSRITPACAGKTALYSGSSAANGDHPRVCGENSITVVSSPFGQGSPPRVRGKRTNSRNLAVKRRITPACAGKTVEDDRWHRISQDHPRVCGENFISPISGLIAPGSPPRVRGKRERLARTPYNQRITPACAGKTHFL